jgi:hypothetical protein
VPNPENNPYIDHGGPAPPGPGWKDDLPEGGFDFISVEGGVGAEHKFKGKEPLTLEGAGAGEVVGLHGLDRTRGAYYGYILAGCGSPGAFTICRGSETTWDLKGAKTEEPIWLGDISIPVIPRRLSAVFGVYRAGHGTDSEWGAYWAGHLNGEIGKKGSPYHLHGGIARGSGLTLPRSWSPF